MLFVFIVNFFLPTYGGDSVKVLAHNAVEALTAAAGTEQGWMLLDPMVRVESITRGVLAQCPHWNATGTGDDLYECDDCGEVTRFGTVSGATATREGFRVYCANLAVR